MYQNVKGTCIVLFWLINLIVLWRSRCRRRRRCLSSLLIFSVAGFEPENVLNMFLLYMVKYFNSINQCGLDQDITPIKVHCLV